MDRTEMPLWTTASVPARKDACVRLAIFSWKSCPTATPSSKRYLSTRQKRGGDANHPTLLRGQSCPWKGGSREIPTRYRPPVLKRVRPRSEEHTSELQSLRHLVCRLLLEKKNK